MAEIPHQHEAQRGGAPDGEPDDAALIARAKNDPAAFEPLYRRYVDPVYRYSLRQLGDPDAAADATSLIFAKAMAGLARCNERSFRSWLFAIAHNVLIDLGKARTGHSALEDAAEVHDPAPSPEELVVAGEQREGVRALLVHLSPDQRAVVELRLAGLKGEAIATVLGRKRSAIDAIQSRAVARLREVLTGSPLLEERHARAR